MRIEDTAPVIIVTMAKKKPKQHQSHQQHENQQERINLDANDEQDGSANISGLKHCAHINKSVNVIAVQRSVKKTVLVQCTSCAASDGKTSNDDNINAAEQPDVYLCLQCAYQGCDRTSPNRHALCHYQTAPSPPHDIAVNLNTFAVWCYACDEFVSSDVSRKLKDCIELLHRHLTAVKKPHHLRTSSSISQAVAEKDCSTSSHSAAGKQQPLPTSSKQVQAPVQPSFSKIKGLANLGNTCFFNAVLQNLCQTHLLEQELRERANKGLSIELVAYSNPEGDEESNSNDDDEQTNKQDCLTVRLPECGPLTQSVLSLFDEVTSSVTLKHRNYISPSGLFNHVCHKAPRFKGFQQQDSHELLRYLLDGMKAEEIKRTQLAILKAFNLSENQQTKDLPNDKKQKVKEFGRSAKHTFVDRIFGGIFISTVVCQSCHVPTQMFEPFLDISLPIADDKSALPVGKSLTDITVTSASSPADVIEDGYKLAPEDKHATKNQLKRQQKLARKQKKKLPLKSVSAISSCNADNEAVSGTGNPTTDAAAEGECLAADEAGDPTADASLTRDSNEQVKHDDAAINGHETVSERSMGDAGDGENDLQRHSEDTDSGFSEDNSVKLNGLNSSRDEVCSVTAENSSSGPIEVTAAKNLDGTAERLSENHPADNKEINSSSVTNGIECCQREEMSADLQYTEKRCTCIDHCERLSVYGDHRKKYCLVNSDDEQTSLEHSNVEKLIPMNDRDEQPCLFGVSRESNWTPNGFSKKIMECGNSVEAIGMINGCAGEPIGTDSDKKIPVAEDMPSQAADHDDSFSTVVGGIGQMSLDDGSLLVENVDGVSMDCSRSVIFNDARSPSPRGGGYNEESGDRNKRTAKLERRHRAMLAAMEPAGVKQKPVGRECSLNACLLQFTAVETLSGSNMLACSTCNSTRQKTHEVSAADGGANTGQKVAPVLTCANKQLLIYAPPAVLTLHLKRFQQVGYNLRKNTQHVVFTELLDLAPYCSAFCEKTKQSATGETQILYSLYGVIEHSGTLRSGHYTAYVKVRQSSPDACQFLQSLSSSSLTVSRLVSRMQSLATDESAITPPGGVSPSGDGRWYHISDTSVSEVRNVENVLNCQAYILFYERVV